MYRVSKRSFLDLIRQEVRLFTAPGGRRWTEVEHVDVNVLSGLHRASVKDGDTAAGLPSQIYTKLHQAPGSHFQLINRSCDLKM